MSDKNLIRKLTFLIDWHEDMADEKFAIEIIKMVRKHDQRMKKVTSAELHCPKCKAIIDIHIEQTPND